MKNNLSKLSLTTLALGAGLVGTAKAQPTQVYLNGQPLRTEVAPMQTNGRTLVPLRDIFEALGATVSYNNLTQAIGATRGTTTVQMSLGSKAARVNNQNITLDVPAQAYYGHTMVPLRFVSEALGANVGFNMATRIVSVTTNGGTIASNPVGGGTSGTQVGGYRQVTIPSETVIPVTLDTSLSSANASVGQAFTSTVVSSQNGDSEFPAGTKIEGFIKEVQRKSGDQPGVLDLRFRTAIFPSGERVPLRGQLLSLDSDNVTQTDGRVVAKNAGAKSDSLKVIGIGAGAGFLVGKLLKKNGIVSALVGAAGGFLYDRSKNKNKSAEATVAAGTRLGVRLAQPLSFRDTSGYYDQRQQRYPNLAL